VIRLGSPCLHIRSEGGDNLWHYCLKIVQRFPLNKNILGVAFLSPPKKKKRFPWKRTKITESKAHSPQRRVFECFRPASPGKPWKSCEGRSFSPVPNYFNGLNMGYAVQYTPKLLFYYVQVQVLMIYYLQTNPNKLVWYNSPWKNCRSGGPKL